RVRLTLTSGWHEIAVLHEQDRSYQAVRLRIFLDGVRVPGYRLKPRSCPALDGWLYTVIPLALLRGAVLLCLCCGVLGAIRSFQGPLIRLQDWLRARIRPLWWFRLAGILLSLAALCWFGHFRVRAVGAADSYGYQESACRMGSGTPVQPETVLWRLGLPPRDVRYTWPLGTYPMSAIGATAPGYQPGLPSLIVVLTRVLGDGAASWISPVSGAITIYLLFSLASGLFGPGTGLRAAVVFGALPLTFYASIQRMSDGLNTCMLWVGLALASRGRGDLGDFLAGLAAGYAVTIRPSSIVFLPVMFAAMSVRGGPYSRRLRSFLLGAASPLTALLAYQDFVYGNPLATGYGDMSQFFSIINIPSRLLHYSVTASSYFMPILLLPAVAGSLILIRTRRRCVFLLMAFPCLAAFYCCYEFHRPWWNERLMLPAVPALVVLAILGAEWILNRLAVSRGRQAVLWLLVMLPACMYRAHVYNSDAYLYKAAAAESRYEEIGAWIDANLEPDAVVFSWLFSGAVRYYGARQTVRWDLGPERMTRRLLEACRQRGVPAYLVVNESWRDTALARLDCAAELLWYRQNTFGYRLLPRNAE
ncbi:hypothetical protein JW905_05595, partial [bacterium]|nr:hypothetical protein [candidate division CSSED10-310 bacterium]